MDEAVNPEVAEALATLLGDARTGRLADDLAAAARRSLQIRQENSRNGGVVLAALSKLGFSWTEIASMTGIPRGTAYRWGSPTPVESDPPPNQ